MAFTGRLGTSDSQLANIELGVAGGGGGTVGASFTANAFVQPYFRADAVIVLASTTASFTADAVILKTQLASFTGNAVIRTGQTASFTADAVVVQTVSASFTGDAVLGAALLADAVIFRTQSASFTASAILFRPAAPSVADDMEVAFEDHFNRTVASGFGDLYQMFFPQSPAGSVDGSVARVDAGDTIGLIAPYGPVNGTVQFDFYVPADTSGFLDYFCDTGAVIHGLNYYYSYLYVVPNGDGTWTLETNQFAYGTSFTPDASSWYTAKLLFYPRLGLERAKVWKVGTAEPDWQVVAPAPTPTSLPPSAGLFIQAGSQGAAFDNYIVKSFPIKILYDVYTDITEDVQLDGATFTSSVNGREGPCAMKVRDLLHTHEFELGRELALELFGRRYWTGFVTNAPRGYYFTSTDQPAAETPRFIQLMGSDLNVLFGKRVLYNKNDPTQPLTNFDAGTSDRTVLLTYLSDHVDLSDDILDLDTWIEAVGTPVTDATIFGNPSETLGSFMDFVRRDIGSIYYIDPYRRFRYTDVETITNTTERVLGISDNPSGDAEIGCHDLLMEYAADRMVNDALIWGAGQGSATMAFSRVTDAASLAEHGRWQEGQFLRSVFRQSSTDRIANSMVYGSPQSLRGGKDDAISVRCIVHTHRFLPSDKVPVRSEVHDLDQVFPVRSVIVNWESNQPVFSLVLSHEIDPPWQTFEWWYPPIPDFTLPEFPSFQIFDPCAPVTACLYDTFNRTVSAGEWGTPDTGADWDSVGTTETNPHVEPSTGYLIDLGSQSGPQDLSSFFQNVFCPRDANDIYIRWSASANLYSQGGLSETLSGDGVHYLWPNLNNDPTPIQQYFSIHVPQVSGLGSNILYVTTDGAGLGYIYPSLLGTVYRSEPIIFSFAADREYIIRISFDGPDDITYYRVKIWPYGAPEPSTWGHDAAIATHSIADSELSIVGARLLDSGQSVGPLEVRIHRVEAVAPPNTCRETFSRVTVDTSWGTSEFGVEWQHEIFPNSGPFPVQPENLYVDGGEAVVNALSTGSAQKTWSSAAALSSPWTFPLEILWEGVSLNWSSYLSSNLARIRVALGMSSDESPESMPGINNFLCELLTEDVNLGGGNYRYDITVRQDSSEGGGGPTYVVVWSSQTYNGDISSVTAILNVRMRIEEAFIGTKIWEQGDIEPGSWTLVDNTTDESALDGQLRLVTMYVEAYGTGFNHPNLSEEDAEARFDKITVIEGCVDLCSSPTPPAPDAPSGQVCEVLTAGFAPPHYPPGNYFSATTNFVSGSTRVWLDGVFLRRGPDYSEGDSYYGGFIHIVDTIDVTGKTVYMCYTADPQLAGG